MGLVRRCSVSAVVFTAAALLASAVQSQTLAEPTPPVEFIIPPLAPESLTTVQDVPVAPTARPRLLAAVAALGGVEGGFWAFDRYVSKYDYAFISLETMRHNVRSGFHFDQDSFTINQLGHPTQGGLFFAAGRANGYGYWQSGAFALAGSLIWECCMETTQPSVNDLVNTTLGGMTRGEISHRLSAMLRDNTADGAGRFLREVSSALIDPVGAFTRLARGDLARDFPNPDDRFPSRFTLAANMGYRSVGGATPHQDLLSFDGFYGDPFVGDTRHPFDAFWTGIDFNASRDAKVSRLEERGLLAGRVVGGPTGSVNHLVTVSQGYEYFNNRAQVFGAQTFGVSLMTRYLVGSALEAVSELGVTALPLAGIQTTDVTNPTGRNYDYVTGGGLRLGGRLFRRGREVLVASYELSGTHTDNGVSTHNTLQNLSSSVRIHVVGPVGIGSGYSWYTRQTTYRRFSENRQTQREWRVFLDVALAQRRGVITAAGQQR
jgi:hypothetical protein